MESGDWDYGLLERRVFLLDLLHLTCRSVIVS